MRLSVSGAAISIDRQSGNLVTLSPNLNTSFGEAKRQMHGRVCERGTRPRPSVGSRFATEVEDC